MTDQILLVRNFDPTLISVGKSKGNYTSIFYHKKENTDEFCRLKIQTPKIKIPFDIQERKSKIGKLFAMGVTVSTDEIGTENNKINIANFRSKLFEVEKQLRKKLPDELRSKDFSSSLWQGSNANFKPTMKLTIPCFKNETPEVAIFDKQGNVSDVSALEKFSICSFIICLDSIWSTDTKVGVNWHIEQAKIYEETKKGKFSFKDDQDDDLED
jgi:hypothetical protein